jgi:hypothetical protein
MNMKLVHVSEESNIEIFIPRIPYRKDVGQSKGLVWALTEHQLKKFLTPRDCPRITYCTNETTTQEDIQKYFTTSSRYCIAIENCWFKTMANTTIYAYEFDSTNFYFDDDAGFYVSDHTEIPISITKYDDLFETLFEMDIEIRILNNLWGLAEELKKTSLNISMCRMGYAKPKLAFNEAEKPMINTMGKAL